MHPGEGRAQDSASISRLPWLLCRRDDGQGVKREILLAYIDQGHDEIFPRM